MLDYRKKISESLQPQLISTYSIILCCIDLYLKRCNNDITSVLLGSHLISSMIKLHYYM